MIDWSRTFPNPLLAAAAAAPGTVALVARDGHWSYQDLLVAVRRRAAGFAALGLEAGQRIGLRMTRTGDDVISLHALLWLGATVAPLGPGEEPAEDIDRSVEVGADGEAADAPAAEPWPLDWTPLMLLTSGTTGTPKRVSLTAGQLVFNAMGSAMRLGHLPGDRWLNPLPLHHVGGLAVLFRCAFGATTVELEPEFDPKRIAGRLASGAVTQVSMVPNMLARVLEHRQQFPGLRTILLGGAKASPELLERARGMGLPVAVSWGMSEAASQVATTSPGQIAPSAAPLPFTVVEEEAGRLLVRGPTAAGTIVTSDRGSIDATGRVTVTGRVDEVIISGGENIDPVEVASVLAEHPAVDRAYVVGLPDERYGQRPAAALVPSGEARPSAAELRRFVGTRIARFKAPDRLLWIQEAPTSAMGKVRMSALRDWLSRVQPGLADRRRND